MQCLSKYGMEGSRKGGCVDSKIVDRKKLLGGGRSERGTWRTGGWEGKPHGT